MRRAPNLPSCSRDASPTSTWILVVVYAAVSFALAALTALSGNWRERLYFGFCATSAAFGLLRQILGDAEMHFAVYVRIVMLTCAVVTGIVIVRVRRLGGDTVQVAAGAP